MTSRDDEGPHATDPVAPSSPEAYERALDRLLDGPEGLDGQGEDAAAAARAEADLELIRRGLRLIAAELATEPSAAAADEAPVAEGSGAADAPIVLGHADRPRPAPVRQGGDARVVPIRRPPGAQPRPVPVPPHVPGEVAPDAADGPWWRRPVPTVLAAAAALAVVIGLAVPALDGMGNGGEDTAQQAPAAAGAAAPGEDADATTGPTSDASGRAGEHGDAAADTGAAAPAADAGAAADTGAAAAPAPAAAAPAAGTAGAAAKTATAAKAAAGESAGAGGRNDRQLAESSTFNRLVACARAIVVAEVVRVENVPGSGRASLTVRVTQYVTGGGPAERTFVVGSPSARFADGTAPLAAGQRGLFLIPGNKDVPVRGWLGDAVPTGRKEVRAAQAQRDSC